MRSPTFPIIVGSSPFIYINTRHTLGHVIIAGGTVQTISFERRGDTALIWFNASSQVITWFNGNNKVLYWFNGSYTFIVLYNNKTGVDIPMAIGDLIQVTYTAAPTMTFVPTPLQ